jgi:hypothetical protein
VNSTHSFWTFNGIVARTLRLVVKVLVKRKNLNHVMVCAALYGMVELFGVNGTINLLKKQRMIEDNARKRRQEQRQKTSSVPRV